MSLLSLVETDSVQFHKSPQYRENQRPLSVDVDRVLAIWSARPGNSDDGTLLQLANEIGRRALDESYASVKAKVDAAGGKFIETTVDGLPTYINANAIAVLRSQDPQRASITMRDSREYVADETLLAVQAKVAAL